jgi:hypothetical protein
MVVTKRRSQDAISAYKSAYFDHGKEKDQHLNAGLSLY